MGALSVVAAALGILVVHSTVVEVRTVGSDSMSPALLPEERILVVKAGLDPWNLPVGEVVLFDAADLWASPDDPAGTVFVKRIVGVGGDRISCCDAEGRLARNGVPVTEPYLADPRSDQVGFDISVQPGHYWLMGDNRAASADSRAHLGDPGGGNVPASRIIGTVEAVVWPPGSVHRVEGSDDAAG
jgi:signal peptidase I